MPPSSQSKQEQQASILLRSWSATDWLLLIGVITGGILLGAWMLLTALNSTLRYLDRNGNAIVSHPFTLMLMALTTVAYSIFLIMWLIRQWAKTHDKLTLFHSHDQRRAPIPKKLFDDPAYIQLLIADTLGYWETQKPAPVTNVLVQGRGAQWMKDTPSGNVLLDSQGAPVISLPEPTAQIPEGAFIDLADLTDLVSSGTVILGIDPANAKPLTVGVRDLVHTALSGVTGRGKSNVGRLLLAQLAYCGFPIYMIDPHYMPLVPTEREQLDWRPIEARLSQPVITDPLDAEDFIIRMIVELEDRIKQGRNGQTEWRPLFIYIDEGPVIAEHAPNFMTCLARLLREGRKYGLFVILSSQDFLVKTLGSSTGVLSNLQTVFYMGGEQYSARTLLGPSASRFEDVLGQGRAIVRNSLRQVEPKLMQVPYASNKAIFALLGQPTPQAPVTSADAQQNDVPRPVRTIVTPPPSRSVSATPPPPPLPARKVRAGFLDTELAILRKLKSGMTPNEVAVEMSNGATGGGVYQKNRKSVEHVLEKVRRLSEQKTH